MNNIFTFKLSAQDAENLVRLLAQLPTSSNVYPLYVAIGTQYQEAVAKQQPIEDAFIQVEDMDNDTKIVSINQHGN